MNPNPQAPLYFVQPHVLDRLLQGVFVAKRSKSKNYKLQDRRDMLSPLNVTRRAVRYEPMVFTNRRELIIDTVQAMNNPENKLFLISGPSGRGKTTFIRGLVEMMGGGKEQLLWFDVSRHTDFDEVVRFLVDYMTYICRMDGQPEAVPMDEANPVSTLEALLRRATDYPILIVIDNMEFLVAPDQSIRSRELKDAFNFLLSFPNIKLLLAGTVLPFADMNPAANAVQHIALPPLTMEESMETVMDWSQALCALPPEQRTLLVSWMGGEPYRLFLLASLFEEFSQPEAWLAERETSPENPDSVLMRFAWQPLSETEKLVLGVLAMLRHGTPPRALQALFRICEPSLKDVDFQHLLQQGLRRVLKKVYPPQLVLDKLRHRNAENAGEMSIEPYYQLAGLMQEYVFQHLPEDKLAEYHDRLHQFYRQEKDKHLLQRLYPARTAHLAAEAQYHLSRMKKRRTMMSRAEGTVEIQMPERKENTLMSPPPPRHPAEPAPDFRAPSAETLPWPTYDEPEPTPMPVPEPYPVMTPYPMGSYPVAMPMPMAQEVRLSQEDLEKLADLITKRNYRPKSAPMPEPPEPVAKAVPVEEASSVIEPEAPVEAAPTEQWFKDLTVSNDPEEQEYQQALAEAMTANNLPAIALALTHLGTFRMKRGLYQNAEGCWLKALEYAETAEYQPLAMQLHGQLGHHFNAHYKHNQAMKHLRAMAHAYESGQWPDAPVEMMVQCYRDMGDIHFYRQAYPEAHQAFETCLGLTIDDLAIKGDVLFRLGLIADELGNRGMALKRYQQAYESASAVRANEICSAVLYNQGSLYFEVGKWDEAEKTLAQCLVYDKQNGMTSDVFRTQMLLSKVNEARKQRKLSEGFAMEALHTAEHLASIPAQVSALIRLGHLAEQGQRNSQALSYYKKAQALGGESLSEDSRSFLKRKRQILEGKPAS